MSLNNLSLAELTQLTADSGDAGKRLTYLFDEGEFTELDKFALSGSEPSERGGSAVCQ